MKKRALRKDFYMEIRRSLGRFLSIFFIVAIGCAFFSGIRASEPDMRYSGDAYFDNKNMMDLRIISTMGLTEDDVKAASKAEGIGHVEGRYSVDALLADGDNQIVVHVMSMLPTMNEIQLEDGRLPNKENECVVDVDYMEKSKLKIGDTITFSSGTDAEVTDSLKTDTFRITGTVSSPEYIAFQRGSTTIGNGSVRAFVYVQEESFAMDVYTEICIQASGAKELTAFTSEYEDTVAKAKENIDFSLYGTPLESTTYKFARCLQERFGVIEGVTDKNYITNSYHVHVTEPINAFDKLSFEAQFQELSPGGAISYVEVPNMQNNIPAVIAVMQHIYENIMYAELNTKSDYCQVCGYDGEIQIVEDDGKLVWECPNCGNRDQNKMSVARRTCGYIGTQFWNQGRTQEIKERVLHL